MKRKLGKGNMRLFVLFSFLALLITGLFIYGIYTAFSYDKNEYEVASGTFTYDSDNSYVKLETDGILQQRWDKKYYLSVTDLTSKKNLVYDLGTDAIMYNENNMYLKIYGTNYQVDSTGKVFYNDKELEVSRNSSSLFYKLDDRKYLIVSKTINTENNEINTDSYLIVNIDKSGNALLLNHELNVKTLSTIILKTAGFDFDVANEKLIISNSKRVIDLKKISGSSNQYVEPEPEEDEEENVDEPTNNSSNSGGSTNVGGNNVGSTGGATGSAGSSIINNSTINNSEELNIVKTAIVTSVVPYTSYIDVYYSVNDPKGEYISVFLDITDSNSVTEDGSEAEATRIILNKDLTRYRIRNLKANTQYSINFGYSYASADNSDIILEDIANSFVAKTNKDQTKINITKISGRNIYFNVTFDTSYSYESANVVVYSDTSVIGRGSVNVTEANRSSGYNGIIQCNNDLGYEIVLKLEDCRYDGESIQSNAQTKFING